MNTTLREKLERTDTVMERRLILLDFVSKHYNSENRAFSTDFKRPVVNPTEFSEGDPVGILLNDDELSGLAGAANQPGFMANLPRWLVEMGGNFLFELQRLHDKPEFWTETGLSEDGRKRVETIKRMVQYYE